MPIDPHKTAALNPTAGTSSDGRSLQWFIPIPDCIGKECVAFHMCKYKKKGRCKLEAEYMLPKFRMYVEEEKGLGNELTDLDLASIGELMCLEHIAFKLLKEIVALRHMTYTDKKGSVRVYPQIGEVARIFRDIDTKRKVLRLSERFEKKFGRKRISLPGPSGQDVERMMTHGDPEYADGLLNEEEEG